VSATGLALVALALMVGGWATWWRRIQRVDVPLRPWAHYAVMAASLLLALAALSAGTGLAAGAAALMALLGSGMFLGLHLISRMPDRPTTVRVGDAAPDFTALDAEGAPFRLSELRGRPVLLKFFRGHW
jgi:cytochrome oxidase Cu insertion factor (SCO1/SenC/PrrC family)